MDTTTKWSVSLRKSSRRSTITLWIFFQLMKEGKFRWCGKSIHGTNTFSNKGSVMEMNPHFQMRSAWCKPPHMIGVQCSMMYNPPNSFQRSMATDSHFVMPVYKLQSVISLLSLKSGILHGCNAPSH